MNTAVAEEILHIALIDDEDDCNFVTKLILKKAGYSGRLSCYTDAQEAFALFGPNIEVPDILFVDINMPGMNGFEFLERCEREGLLPNGHTSVVMFSSSNRTADLERAHSFRSVIDYVEKALSVDSFERIAAAHGRRQS